MDVRNKLTQTGEQVQDILNNVLLKKEQTLSEDEQGQVKANLGLKDVDLTGYATEKYVDEKMSHIPIPDVSEQIKTHNTDVKAHPYIQNNIVSTIKEALIGYVKKDGDKVLSSNDFTDDLKRKLEGLSSFDASSIESDIKSLQNTLNKLIGNNASTAIDNFNEIISFLEGLTDDTTLSGLIKSLNEKFSEFENKFVQKEEGKGLSSNDFSMEEKTKLEGLTNYDDTEIKDIIEGLSKQLNVIPELERLIASHNKEIRFFCVEPVTVVVGETEYHFDENQIATVFVGDEDFEIIPTSNRSIQSLLGYPIPLTWYDWLEGVEVFDGIIFDMNELETYHHWIQYYQGEYHVQKAQYTNCVFWSDKPYTHNPFDARTNYTIYYSSQLPLCYSRIPENTYKPFYLAYSVNNDPNWRNPHYVNSFSLVSGAPQTFSYYGARAIGLFDMEVDVIPLPKDCRGMMWDSPAIEYAGVFDATKTTDFGAKKTSWQQAFGKCGSLKTIYIKNLKTSVNFSWSPVDVRSIEYIINNAINTSKITISVSPYTWYRLTDDIKQAATAKNIVIELITTNYDEDSRLSTFATKSYVDEQISLLKTELQSSL